MWKLLLSAKIMSNCHSVITLLGTISYSTLFLCPCESCYKTIRLTIQAFNSIIFHSSYSQLRGSDEPQFLERSLAQSHDRPPYCGGGVIYFQAPECGPARLSCCGKSEVCVPSSWAQVCSHSFACLWRNNQSGFRDKIIHKMQLQELYCCTASCSRTLPHVASRGWNQPGSNRPSYRWAPSAP